MARRRSRKATWSGCRMISSSPLFLPHARRLFSRKHLRREEAPLILQRQGRHGSTRALVPSAGVPHVAFLAMQVRVHPIAVRLAFVLLDAFMRLFPITTKCPPQPLQARPPICRHHPTPPPPPQHIDRRH